jgi:FkbM family methyltransferase
MIATPNGIFQIDPEDCYIRNHMMSGQVFESHIINGMLKEYVEKSKYIVDVGANIGCHCISYSHMNPDAKIWAFEPQDKLFNILDYNVRINNLGDRIKIYKEGLSHKDTISTLSSLDTVEDKRCMGWNKGGLGIGKGGEEIKLTTLDSLNLPGLDYIKIDVEGAEGLVIRGGQETIKKFKPIIVFEHNYQRIDPTVVDLEYVPTPFEELVKLGYKTFKYLDWDNYIATST